MKKDSQRLEPVIEPAIEVLRHVFTADNTTDEEVARARIAASALATWSRLVQAERAQEAMYFGMARELASDAAQLEEYIRISMPDTPLVKAIGRKKAPELPPKTE